MEQCILGRTGLKVTRTGFGALPIQRLSVDEAARLLRNAFDRGITFFDTARGYSDSEAKICRGLGPVRDRIVLADKAPGKDRATLTEQIDTSLRTLGTDWLDIYQIHNPAKLPDPNDANSSYAALVEAKRQGKIRFIGVTSHQSKLWREALASGLYDTIQIPLSAISSDDDFHFAEDCGRKNVGVIAMKPMCGGLLAGPKSTFVVLRQFPHVVPIWGFQRQGELDDVLALEANPPKLDAALRAQIERERVELAGEFCRGCGYCMPCPQNIPIHTAARMAYLLRRSPWEPLVTQEWRQKMSLIEKCENCGACRKRCPYGLDTPKLLKKMFEDYQQFVQEKGIAD